MSAPSTVSPEVKSALASALDAHMSAEHVDSHMKAAVKFDFASILSEAEALYPTVVTIYNVLKPGMPANVTLIADATIKAVTAVIGAFSAANGPAHIA